MHTLENIADQVEWHATCSAIYTIDGNTFIQALAGVFEIFKEIAKKEVDTLPEYERAEFVSVAYNKNSVKSSEWTISGVYNTFLII